MATAGVLGVEPALETVCMNLVLNAADAMPVGGVVKVSARREDDTVRLTVTDAGSGVPEELRERILEPFFTTKGNRGTGLGLSLCRSIIERHGGRVWVESVKEGGSRFTVSLPALPDSAL
jgi:signal transduction histidine kinase